MGGSILTTEVQVLDGKGKLTITGQLGDVMQESAQAALSYIRGKAQVLGLSREFYRNVDLHLHVPEGAIPKDGPSAGITMATALASALAKIPVRRDVAMTGEITLRGKVLAIGGLKEKLLAALRAGIFEVILPRANEKDIAELPDNIKNSIKLHFVDSMDEVLALALESPLPLSCARGNRGSYRSSASGRRDRTGGAAIELSASPVTEAPQPRQQSSNPHSPWSTTAEEQVIVPPRN